MNLSQTVEPKSDQLNADDLISGPITITVTKVSANTGDKSQPVNIHYAESNRPYRPCKSMRRVLIAAWGADGSKYAGRRMTLYRDDSVMFGGIAVGGIRISHMSDIQGKLTLALTTTRSKRKMYSVEPLAVAKNDDEQIKVLIVNLWKTNKDETQAAMAAAGCERVSECLQLEGEARAEFVENLRKIAGRARASAS